MDEILEGEAEVCLDITRPNGDRVSLLLDAGFVVFCVEKTSAGTSTYGNLFIDKLSPITGGSLLAAEQFIENAEPIKQLGIMYARAEAEGRGSEFLKMCEEVSGRRF